MQSTPPIYGFDLVTDAVGDTIDPLVNRVVAVGLSTPSGTALYDGPEVDILRMVDSHLSMLEPGVLTCWQGSVVALPFLSCRAETLGLPLGMTLHEDRRVEKTSALEGLNHPWLISWHGHRHLDLKRVYSSEGRRRLTLRNRVDPESLIPAVDPLAARSPERDATLARRLAERRWGQAKRHVDQMPGRATTQSVLQSLQLAD
ncbi:MAG: hypothetical protein R2706_01145 [Acidimicrobiales bacterium]